MLDANSIQQLFANVLHEDIARYGINHQDIRRAVQNMAHVYAPQPNSLQSSSIDVANYNDAAHRCAYLHKYASFHTAMVQDMMIRILEQRWELFKPIIASENFRLCSLGGGPGSDVIGVIAALVTLFSSFKANVTIIDIMEHWEFTFSSVIAELVYGNYGTLRTSVSDNFLKWNYIGANLLDNMTNPVNRAISQASLITMVKFVSASACQDTENMIKKIFRSMKPGALLLFIDNAAGGFHGLVSKVAREYRFVTKFGPLYHNTYSNETLKTDRFGYTSCFTTTVTVHLLLKPRNQQGTKHLHNIPVSPHELNSYASSDVNVYMNPDCKQLPSHNNPWLFQNANVPVHNKPSTSQNINNLNKSVHPPVINAVKSNNLPSNQNTNYNFSQTRSNRSQNIHSNTYNQYAYRVLPPNNSRTDSAVSTQSQSGAALEPEDNSDNDCSCCVIS